jgi:D-alanyl-D-alanine carboxypeptidase
VPLRALPRALIALLVVAALGLVALPQRAAVAAARTPGAQASTGSVAGPKVLAEGAILVDAASGAVLWQREGETRRPPASLTKMLTALTAEASLRADKRVTVSAKAAAVEPTKVGLLVGRHLTVEQAIEALMIISANDMAISLAETAGKDPDGGTSGTAAAEARFIKALNAQSKRLGMEHSTWKTPNGLDAAGHRTTPFDLAIAARAVLRDAKLARIVKRTEILRIVTPDGIRVSLRPRNGFLRTYPGAIGIKTGFTDNAGHCLAAAATRNGRTLIAIVLDSPNPSVAAATLMDWGFGPGKAERTGQRLPEYVEPISVEKLLAPPPPPTTQPPLPDIDPELAQQGSGLGANAIAPAKVRSWGRAATTPAILLPGAASLATGCSALLLVVRRRRRRGRRGRGGAHAPGAGRAAARAGARPQGRHRPGPGRRTAGPPLPPIGQVPGQMLGQSPGQVPDIGLAAHAGVTAHAGGAGMGWTPPPPTSWPAETAWRAGASRPGNGPSSWPGTGPLPNPVNPVPAAGAPRGDGAWPADGTRADATWPGAARPLVSPPPQAGAPPAPGGWAADGSWLTDSPWPGDGAPPVGGRAARGGPPSWPGGAGWPGGQAG